MCLWVRVKEFPLPVSLWAEVAHQVARPEQWTGVGAKRSQEHSRSLHVTLQPHEPHRDIHRGYVIGVPLRWHQRQLNESLNKRQQADKKVTIRINSETFLPTIQLQANECAVILQYRQRLKSRKYALCMYTPSGRGWRLWREWGECQICAVVKAERNLRKGNLLFAASLRRQTDFH